MPILQLHHDPRLAYAEMKDLPLLSSGILAWAKEDCVITFRQIGHLKPDLLYKQVNGCSRFLDFPSGNLIFCGIENDSPLAPLILWDAAHRLPQGASITLLEHGGQPSYLERAYFKPALSVEYKDKERLVLRKKARLLAEEEAGLDRWSFCIPTGPGDPTGLNVVVKRILELAIPEKEILLCGRPDKKFLYWDKVRIVGEDIPAPPVWITRKKNVLVKEARFENVCLLHDRVFLPLNFMSAIRQFGDYFPFAGFQSLWFDDVLNLSPVRYSDYNCVENISDMVALKQSGQPSLFVPKLFTEIEKQNFKYANPIRYQCRNYLTGSLYIAKRRVWLQAPQNEDLYWAEFEDIEQGKKCELQGIPHRIIPGAFTQSLFARPLLYFAGYTGYLSANGMIHSTRKILPLPARFQKPLIKLSEAEGNKRFLRFNDKYCPHLMTTLAGEKNIIAKMFAAIYMSHLPFREKAIRKFVDDIEQDLLCDQMGYGAKQWLVEQFILNHKATKLNFSHFFHDLFSQLALRPHGRRFYHSLLDYFPKRTWIVKLGSLISAIRLAVLNGHFLYHPDGWRGYYQAILASTPYLDYTESEAKEGKPCSP